MSDTQNLIREWYKELVRAWAIWYSVSLQRAVGEGETSLVS